MVIYFSATGNSKYVAQALAEHLDDALVSGNDYIKANKKGEFESEKPWVFVFPIYLSNIVSAFADFIKKAEFRGNKDAYFIGTCVSSNGSAPNDCEKICKAKGLVYKGSEKVLMPQSYVAMFKSTPDDECERRFDAALETAADIGDKIAAGEELNMKNSSAIEYYITKGTEVMYSRWFTKTTKFYATDECVGCGLCVKLCPLNNIRLKDGKPEWIGNCLHCMACINNCPKKAIEYGNKTQGKKRYVCRRYRKKAD